MPLSAYDDQPSLTHVLKGVFAYSYSGYLSASDTPPHGVPQIGSYLERTRPATSVIAQRGWEVCDEIDGYVLVDYVGWVEFHGDGQLSGGGTSQRAGEGAVPFTHSGYYVVEDALPQMLVGESVAKSSIILTRIDVECEPGRELKFTVLGGDEGKLVACGMMKG